MDMEDSRDTMWVRFHVLVDPAFKCDRKDALVYLIFKDNSREEYRSDCVKVKLELIRFVQSN